MLRKTEIIDKAGFYYFLSIPCEDWDAITRQLEWKTEMMSKQWGVFWGVGVRVRVRVRVRFYLIFFARYIAVVAGITSPPVYRIRIRPVSTEIKDYVSEWLWNTFR